MAERLFPSFERLPELYRLRDPRRASEGLNEELSAFLGVIDGVFREIHADLEQFYDDHFIETCRDWVVPYIADLLGTTHLRGDPRTVRRDVAATIPLRRRKGTLYAVEELTRNLTEWGVAARELRDRLVWSQHLNHQQPDRGGRPPLIAPGVDRFSVLQGGLAPVRDPATLALLGTPFGSFARHADLRPRRGEVPRFNLPNVGVYLWRLRDHFIPRSPPAITFPPPLPAVGSVVPVRFTVDPLGRACVLFNRERPVATDARAVLDAMPGPIPSARLTSEHADGRPESYVALQVGGMTTSALAEQLGLVLHLPATALPGFDPDGWRFRGANLCAWEQGLRPALRAGEVVIDPARGRVVLGVLSDAEAVAVSESLRISYTIGSVGPVGAVPGPRSLDRSVHAEEGAPTWAMGEEIRVPADGTLEAALGAMQAEVDTPLVITLEDSEIHSLDVSAVSGAVFESGAWSLTMGRPVLVRAADHQRPIVRLARSLRVRPTRVQGAGAARVVRRTRLRLEGLFLTSGESPAAALVARASIEALEIDGCTLDPAGHLVLDGTRRGSRASAAPSLELAFPYGFEDPDDEQAFAETPSVHVRRSILGPMRVDAGHELFLTESVVDEHRDGSAAGFSLTGLTGAAADVWSARVRLERVTFFGRVRAEQLSGEGTIFRRRLEVRQHQQGCIRTSWFSGDADRLPQNHACASGPGARLRFVSDTFGRPGYAQLHQSCDRAVLERGPDDAEMGAFGFLLDAHKWRNLALRLREFNPVGVYPLLIPVT